MGTVARHVSIPRDVSNYRLPNTTITGSDRRPPSDNNAPPSGNNASPSDNNVSPSDNNPDLINPVIVNPSTDNNPDLINPVSPSSEVSEGGDVVVSPSPAKPTTKTVMTASCPAYQSAVNTQIVGFVRVFMFFTTLVLAALVFYGAYNMLHDTKAKFAAGVIICTGLILCWSIVRHKNVDYGDSCRMDKPTENLNKTLRSIKNIIIADFCLVSIPSTFLTIIMTPSTPTTFPQYLQKLINKGKTYASDLYDKGEAFINRMASSGSNPSGTVYAAATAATRASEQAPNFFEHNRRWIFVGLSALMTILLFSYWIKLLLDPIVRSGFPESALVNFKWFTSFLWIVMLVRTIALGVLAYTNHEKKADIGVNLLVVFVEWIMTLASYDPGSSF